MLTSNHKGQDKETPPYGEKTREGHKHENTQEGTDTTHRKTRSLVVETTMEGGGGGGRREVGRCPKRKVNKGKRQQAERKGGRMFYK